jgi:hypothetical protein
MLTLIEAIAKMEGFGADPENLPTRRNNPGDIVDGEFAQIHGALPSDGSRFAAFPDATTGFAALRALLTEHYLGMTVHDALNKYAPPVENDTSAYESFVCKETGCQPTDVLTAALIG